MVSIRIFFTASLICTVFFPQLSQSQEAFDHQSRAEYIFDIARYVNYEKEAVIREFRIGILGTDTALYEAMQAEAARRDSVQQKPVKIYLFDKPDDFVYCHVLYTHKEYGFKLPDIYKAINQRPVLLITENYPFHQSMLNFTIYKGRKAFELNTRLLKKHFLTVPRLLTAQAVKTRADWEKIGREAEESLIKKRENTEHLNRERPD